MDQYWGDIFSQIKQNIAVGLILSAQAYDKQDSENGRNYLTEAMESATTFIWAGSMAVAKELNDMIPLGVYYYTKLEYLVKDNFKIQSNPDLEQTIGDNVLKAVRETYALSMKGINKALLIESGASDQFIAWAIEYGEKFEKFLNDYKHVLHHSD